MFPRWFFWLFLVFLGYLIFLGTLPAGAPQTVGEASPPITEKTYPTLARFTDAEYWKRSLNPDYAAEVNCNTPEAQAGKFGIKVSIDTTGAGEPATCGDTITLHLVRWDSRGALKDEKDITLRIGESGIAGFDAALVGLKPGAARTVIIAPFVTNANSPLQALIPANRMNIVTVSLRSAPPAQPKQTSK